MQESVLYESSAFESLVDSFFSKIRSELLTDSTYVVGIRTGGDVLADRLAASMDTKLDVGYLDITLYRDDFAHRSHWPAVQATQLDIHLDGRDILLIDDVMFTGRTIRAAMDAVIEFGRPNTIKLATLLDRGSRELPIQPEVKGADITVDRDDLVLVEFAEHTKQPDRVVVRKRRDQ